MAGVREVFEIVDRATRPLRNIGNQMERVTQTAKSLGTQVEETTQKVNGMSGAFTRVFAGLATLATVKKALDLSDELTLTSARLANVNDGLQTTEELQERIYQAALRSRGCYLGMIQTVASLKAQTGDTFSSVQEAVNFTELLQKQFKIAGTDATGIASTMYNLTQALSTGVLRGQDLNIVMSNAPQIAQRIARYMGLTVGQLKEVASRGQVTSDVVKAAMLGAADDINAQFEKMPMTFGDAMQKLWNMGVRVFQLLGNISEAINSSQAEQAINGLGQALYVITAIFGQLILFIIDGFNIFAQGLGVITQGFGGMGSIAVAVVGGIVGIFVAAEAIIINIFIGIANVFIELVETLQNNWANFVYDAQTKILQFATGAMNAFAGVARGAETAANAIATAFVNGANIAIGGINKLIEAINHIPGVNIGQVSTLAAPAANHAVSNQIETNLRRIQNALSPEAPFFKMYDRLQYHDVGASFQSGKDIGSNWMQGIIDGMKNLTDAGTYGGGEEFGTPTENLMPNGGNVGKVGKVGKVDEVKLSDEDLKIYRDLAERRYMNNIELKTLAPEINVTLPAGASGNLSAQDVADKLKRMLIEQMAAQTSVAHA